MAGRCRSRKRKDLKEWMDAGDDCGWKEEACNGLERNVAWD